MKDFRDKIKNYKSTPSKNAWTNFELKSDLNNEPKGLDKVKGLNYLLLALNLVALLGLLGLSYTTYNNRLDLVDIEKDDLRFQQLKNHHNNTIVISDSINLALTHHLASLQSELKTLKAQHLLVKMNQNSIFDAPKPKEILKTIVTPTVLSNEAIKPTPSSPNLIDKKPLKILPTQVAIDPFKNINKLGYKILHPIANHTLGINDTPMQNPFNNQITYKKKQFNLVRISAGVGVSGDVFGRNGPHYLLSMQRDIKRRLAIGLRVGYVKTEESVDYTLFEDIKDHEIETSGYVYLRYTPFSYQNLKLNFDVGAGASHFLRSFRKNSFNNNQISYFNDARYFTDFSGVLAAGLTYDLSTMFGIEVLYSVYPSSEQQSLGFNLSYKFPK